MKKVFQRTKWVSEKTIEKENKNKIKKIYIYIINGFGSFQSRSLSFIHAFEILIYYVRSC
jgi:hypothetical protein